jgi:hypothetical protein
MNHYPKNLRGGKVWRSAKFSNTRAGTTMEALTDGDGKQPNTIAKKEEMLRRESFPPNEYDQYFKLPPAGQAHQSVAEQAVEIALFLLSVITAPSPDKLSFRAVRLLWKWNKERIVELAKAAVRTGRHPAVWKLASEVVIRKPGKNDYTKLKA